MRTVTLLGSTGSIGTQALDVVAPRRDRFEVYGLAAGGGHSESLARQVLDFTPAVVAVADEGSLESFERALATVAGQRDVALPRFELLTGPLAATDLAGRPVDVVLNGVTGSIGLAPSLAALEAGSVLALANKESLVAGGALVTGAVRREGQIVPVDSEHSAIAQCLRGGAHGEVRRLILTASGGPFRGWRREQLSAVTPAQALAHPTWNMGPVVTINSSTMVNKALEMIEAHHLFAVAPEDIVVVVHPQSMVHSMVEFHDGATIAQASPPDMRLPIALGLSWPERLASVARPCAWNERLAWTFEPLDEATFTAVELARWALRASPLHPAVLNAANEECVAAFLAGQITYLDIVDTIDKVVHAYIPSPLSDPGFKLQDVMVAEEWAREKAQGFLTGKV